MPPIHTANPSSLRRIHIIGAPGSGKTTLARQLSTYLDAPYYELDAIGYEGGAGAERPLQVRLADNHRIADELSWVTEGIFLGWTDKLFQEADVIVWLDLGWYIGVWRVVVRHIRLSLAGNNPHAGLGKLLRFVAWQLQYYYWSRETSPEHDAVVNRAATAQALKKYHDKVICCRYPREVDRFLRQLAA